MEGAGTACGCPQDPDLVTLIELLPFGWDHLSLGSQHEAVLTEPVGIAGAISGELLIRVHENGLSSETGAGVTFYLDRISHSDDEPATTFVDSTPIASIDLDSNDPAGTLKRAQLRWPVPATTRLRMVASQADASVQDNVLKISADLLLHPDGACCSDWEGET